MGSANPAGYVLDVRTLWGLVVAVVALIGGCAVAPSSSQTPVGTSGPNGTSTTSAPRTGPEGRPFVVEEIAELEEPEAGSGGSGAAVDRATLSDDRGSARLESPHHA